MVKYCVYVKILYEWYWSGDVFFDKISEWLKFGWNRIIEDCRIYVFME